MALFFALSLSSQAMNPVVDEELTPAIATTLMKNYVAALPNKAQTLMERECGEQEEPYHQIHLRGNYYNNNRQFLYVGDCVLRFLTVTFGSAAAISSLDPEYLFGSTLTGIIAFSSVGFAVGECILKRSQEQTKEAYFSRKLFIQEIESKIMNGNRNYLFNEPAKNILSEEIKNELNRMWQDRLL